MGPRWNLQRIELTTSASRSGSCNRGAAPDNARTDAAGTNPSGAVIGRGTQDPAGTHGGAYAPYVVERWTSAKDNQLTIYYVLSTWNPYVVVLMQSRFQIAS